MDILHFLDYLRINFHCSYSALNTARSTLSGLVDLSDSEKQVGEHPLVSRYLLGVYQATPSKPRYSKIWDVGKVLARLEKMSPAKHLSIKDLSCKLAVLILLATGQRVQTLSLLNIDTMIFTKQHVTFQIIEKMKQSRPGKDRFTLSFKRFHDNPRLCIVHYLDHYLRRTQSTRNSQFLFVSLNKPHHRVTVDTLSRWVKIILKESGIDLQLYGSHSVRSASTSSAAAQGVPINDILKQAGWSTKNVFCKWYQRPVEANACNSNNHVFQNTVLNTKH